MFWLLLLFINTAAGRLDPVAFTLGQDSHFVVSDSSTVPFSKVITVHNIGNDLHNGMFTCSSPGVYKLQVYSLTQKDKRLFLDLYKNSEVIFSLWSHTPEEFAAAGNAAIVELHTGDTVRVVSRNHQTTNLYGAPDEIYTTFTVIQMASFHPVESEETLASFSVGLTHDQVVTGGKSVVYNKVILDTVQGYDKSTGIYTAPSGGIYIFNFFSIATRNQSVKQDLYHNGDIVCSLFAMTNNDYGNAGNTAILHLRTQDQVMVKAGSPELWQDNHMFGRPDQICSTFSGSQLITEAGISEAAVEKHDFAFSAGLSSGYNVSQNNKVIFDLVFINLNHAYDHHTGEYIVPVSGLYEFNYHALATRNHTVFLDLYHNYRYVNSLYSRTPSLFATAGNAAVIKADAGDVIYVRSRGQNYLLGNSDEVFCTFSGYLLEPAHQDVVIG